MKRDNIARLCQIHNFRATQAKLQNGVVRSTPRSKAATNTVRDTDEYVDFMNRQDMAVGCWGGWGGKGGRGGEHLLPPGRQKVGWRGVGWAGVG